jgi:hypothetical protein
MDQRYQTTVAYKPQNAGEAVRMTSLGQALAELTTSFVFAGGAMVVILVLGTLVWAGLHRQWIWRTADPANRLILLSAVPWGVVLLRFLNQAWGALRLPQNQKRFAHMVASGNGFSPEPVKEHHLVPVYIPESTLEGLPISVIVEFIEQLQVRGHTKRSWVNAYTFRNGMTCDYQTWSTLCGILEKVQILVDRGERKAGRLVTSDPNEILARLRLSSYSHLLRGPQSEAERH